MCCGADSAGGKGRAGRGTRMLAATGASCIMQISTAVAVCVRVSATTIRIAVTVGSVITVVYCTADRLRREISLTNHGTVCV
jgi:hypothetical protein